MQLCEEGKVNVYIDSIFKGFSDHHLEWFLIQEQLAGERVGQVVVGETRVAREVRLRLELRSRKTKPDTD